MQSSSNYFVKHEPCPKCRSIGNDKSGDNLGIWSDGSTYCFRCGYTTSRKSFARTKPIITQTIGLPADVTTQLPVEARAWLQQYSLARLDIQQHHIMWSEKWSRIIFPYFDDTGLIAWQGRYVPCGKNKVEVNGKIPAKWFSQGKIHEIIHPIKLVKREAILVEDIVSAIKVSKVCGAIPIFGSSISQQHMLRLKTLVDRVWYWLDPDMRTKSVSMAFKGNLLGLESHVIFSDKDPKEHSDDDIYGIIQSTKS